MCTPSSRSTINMRKSPITVQQWVDTIPSSSATATSASVMNTASFYSPPLKTPPKKILPREFSLQSDDASSHCSSVESVLELRKPDPETVLLELGFGPPKNSNSVSRIPSRFLQPSKVSVWNVVLGEATTSDDLLDLNSAPSSPARTRPKTS